MQMHAERPGVRPNGRVDACGPMRHSRHMRARDWQRLAGKIRKRRAELDLSQQQVADAARVSLRTVASLESGQPAKERTLVRVERALEWTAGSMDAVLDSDVGEATPISVRATSKTDGEDDPVALILNADSEELFAMYRTVEADSRYGQIGAERWLLDALKVREAARQRKEGTKSNEP